MVHVVGDAAYVGERLRDVDARISWTSRLKVTSVLHELPPPRTGRSGRPRTRGARLGTPTDLAALATTTNTWRTTQVRRYGRTDTVQITERVLLMVRLVPQPNRARDPGPQRQAAHPRS